MTTLEPEQIRFVTANVTPEEVAAVTAVLTAAAAEQQAAAREDDVAGAQDAWARSQRSLRTPLQPGEGAWRSFSV
ncbi:acyl-CoA carboxylase epsilon subunit [Leifsonia sp. NPDC058292]|uniref:acyl-CoA carboxylase epsilon subunit n=1 Tax=Leifsonia sp. NPDC058292 TaxID=3346428 RepID=UPI0036D90544